MPEFAQTIEEENICSTPQFTVYIFPSIELAQMTERKADKRLFWPEVKLIYETEKYKQQPENNK